MNEKEDNKRSFSQRMGLTPVKTKIQIDNIDNDLRVKLWNKIFDYYLTRNYMAEASYAERQAAEYKDIQDRQILLNKVWTDYLNRTKDSLLNQGCIAEMQQVILRNPWYEVYDLLEFIVKYHLNEYKNSAFIESCNSVLEQEVSAYRFVGKKIVQITSEVEITEIQDALDATASLTSLKGANIHLNTALERLADKQSPDYRNSIKESISAVETVCVVIAGKDNAKTLAKALNYMENHSIIKIHGALKQAFSSLYGYASDADGIRHGLLEPNLNLEFDDAKYMLVTCTAFINYLVSKASKAGINL
jgi:hypothetical protein